MDFATIQAVDRLLRQAGGQFLLFYRRNEGDSISAFGDISLGASIGPNFAVGYNTTNHETSPATATSPDQLLLSGNSSSDEFNLDETLAGLEKELSRAGSETGSPDAHDVALFPGLQSSHSIETIETIETIDPILRPGSPPRGGIVTDITETSLDQKWKQLKSEPTSSVVFAMIKTIYGIKQLTSRRLATHWVRAAEPKKRSKYPYKNGESSKPSWWPRGARHKEPVHLYREERVLLLMAIALKRSTPIALLDGITSTALKKDYPIIRFVLLCASRLRNDGVDEDAIPQLEKARQRASMSNNLFSSDEEI